MAFSLSAGATLSGVTASKLKIAGLDLTLLAHYGSWVAYALGVFFGILLAYRVLRQAVVIKDEEPPPPPTAIKGLLPFTVDDGNLFARLGRSIELQRLIAIAQSDQIAICAVRGQSGAGKTSLLQAGLMFRLGKEKTVYWEAIPTAAPDALLHALRTRFSDIASLESLPDQCPSRCVLIIDQLEQLSHKTNAHSPIFDLLGRIAKAPAPHILSAVVGFRREYLPDWSDFEYQFELRSEPLPIKLLAPSAASQTLIILTGEAGFTLDQALVDNFISSVTAAEGVSPVDIAIGVLSLANFVQQRGINHVHNSDYTSAGGVRDFCSPLSKRNSMRFPNSFAALLLPVWF